MLQNDLFRHVNRWASSADIFKSQRHQISKVKQWVQKLPFVHWVHCRAVFQTSLLVFWWLFSTWIEGTLRPECCHIIRNIANDFSSRNKIWYSTLFMWSHTYIYIHIYNKEIYISFQHQLWHLSFWEITVYRRTRMFVFMSWFNFPDPPKNWKS